MTHLGLPRALRVQPVPLIHVLRSRRVWLFWGICSPPSYLLSLRPGDPGPGCTEFWTKDNVPQVRMDASVEEAGEGEAHTRGAGEEKNSLPEAGTSKRTGAGGDHQDAGTPSGCGGLRGGLLWKPLEAHGCARRTHSSVSRGGAHVTVGRDTRGAAGTSVSACPSLLVTKDHDLSSVTAAASLGSPWAHTTSVWGNSNNQVANRIIQSRGMG